MTEYSKKLHIRKDGTIQDISLYTDVADISTNDKLTIVDGNTKVYAAIAETTKQEASSLRIRKNNTIYAVLLKARIYNLENYYKKIPGSSTISTLPEENASYIKEALPNVTSCYGMLIGCNSLTSIDTTKWNTSNVTDMSYMFSGCGTLTTIKGVIDMKSCTEYRDMFNGCTKLKGVKIKNPPADFETYSGLTKDQYEIVS